MLPSTLERKLMAELANRINCLAAELGRLEKAMTKTVAVYAPQLLALSGIGYDSATALIIAVGTTPNG